LFWSSFRAALSVRDYSPRGETSLSLAENERGVRSAPLNSAAFPFESRMRLSTAFDVGAAPGEAAAGAGGTCHENENTTNFASTAFSRSSVSAGLRSARGARGESHRPRGLRLSPPRLWTERGLTPTALGRKPLLRSDMRMRGLEPPRGLPHTDLNRARLPIPPHPRAGTPV
jgi:hypothetical protein